MAATSKKIKDANLGAITTTAYEVKSTNDLTLFKPSIFNREYKPNKELYKSIMNNGFKEFYPIVIAKDGTIVDGTTRYLTVIEIVKAMGKDITQTPFPVYFYIDESLNTEDDVANAIKARNTQPRSWKNDDFFHSLCTRNIPSYQDFNEARNAVMVKKRGDKETPVLALGIAALCYTHGLMDSGSKLFKEGLMPMGDKELIKKVSNFIVECNVISGGKRETSVALFKWFLYVDPYLTDKQREVFKKIMVNYAIMCETSQHIDEWLKKIGLKRSTKEWGVIQDNMEKHRAELMKQRTELNNMRNK